MKKVFINEVKMDDDFTQYIYLPNIEESWKVTLEILIDDKVLVIFTRNYYRKY